MLDDEYVALKSGRPGASFLRRNIDFAPAWGEYHVLPAETWKAALLHFGMKPLAGQDKVAWKDIEFAGFTTYGVWIKGGSMIDVLRVTNTASTMRGLIHVSEAAYDDLRTKLPLWWRKAFEQKGWDKVPPVALAWQRCYEPTPAETKQYVNLLKQKGWESTIPAEKKRFTALQDLCDPNGKLLKMAQAKAAGK